MIRNLLMCQVHDPGRGSFMVNPMPVKDDKGRIKTKRSPRSPYRKHVVYRAAHFRARVNKRGSSSFTPHPDAYDYIVIDHQEGYK